MSDEQINYVVSQLKAGVTEEDLVVALRNSQYKEEKITNLLAEANKRMHGVSAPPPPALGSTPQSAAPSTETQPEVPNDPKSGSWVKRIFITLLLLTVLGMGHYSVCGLI